MTDTSIKVATYLAHDPIPVVQTLPRIEPSQLRSTIGRAAFYAIDERDVLLHHSDCVFGWNCHMRAPNDEPSPKAWFLRVAAELDVLTIEQV